MPHEYSFFMLKWCFKSLYFRLDQPMCMCSFSGHLLCSYFLTVYCSSPAWHHTPSLFFYLTLNLCYFLFSISHASFLFVLAGSFRESVDDPHSKSWTVSGLEEDRPYTFQLAACTSAGCGPETTTIFRTRQNCELRYWFKPDSHWQELNLSDVL